MKSPLFYSAFLILFLTSANTSAQNYVISVRNDTLRGDIKILAMEPVDRLQVIVDGKKTNYTAIQVKSFVKDGAVYQPVKYENTIRFMKILKPGYLSLCAFIAPGQSGWDGRYLLKKDGSGMDVPNLSFKKFMSKFLADCADVQSRIDKGELTKRDIDRIVDLYNTCLQTKTEGSNLKQAPPASFDTDKVLAIKNLKEKVGAENFDSKNDALDLLNDLQAKVSRNERVPNYMIEGMKSYLGSIPSLSNNLNEVLALFKK